MKWRKLTSLCWSSAAAGVEPIHDLWSVSGVETEIVSETEDAKILLPDSGARWEVVFPLEDGDLLNKFAIKEPSKADVRRLCLQFGFLHRTSRFDVHGHEQVIFQETHQLWAEELHLLWLVMQLHHALENDDMVEVQVLLPKADQVWRTPSLREFHRAAREGVLRQRLTLDEFRPIYRQVHEAWKREDVQTIIARTIAWKAGTASVDVVVVDGVLQITLVPPDLLSAVWLRMAQLVANKSAFLKCHHCGLVYTPESRRSHSDKMYCSKRCKQAAYNARKPSRRSP